MFGLAADDAITEGNLPQLEAGVESVQASVVRAVLSLEEIRECRNLAESLGIRKFRVR